ncbi:Calmodulin [Cytospora mali]|uniref:Calmodulin n=1 Tax=Cytospora mali TaxID=578113 RepID=A0A194VJT4_CYTMA|nr:Calmodulin [Valsa mali]
MVRTAPRYLPTTTKQLSAEEIAIFKNCFNEYDTDQGGNITVEEFARVMRKTTPSISDEEVSKIVSEVDLDGDGTINFDEFITMMTGQPYKSPEPAAATGEKKTETDGTLNITVSSAAAVRGVSTVSAKLQRQRLASQIYKDAWMEIDPSLKGSITPTELKQVAARAGLVVNDSDVEEMVDPTNGEGANISYDRFLEFAKRQEVDDIVSGYGAL